MPRVQRATYADRVNYYLAKNNLETINLDALVDGIVGKMKENGEVVTRCTHGCILAYVQSLIIQRLLSRDPSDRELVRLSEKFQRAIDRIRDCESVELEYANMARISSLLRVAAGSLKSLTARELRDRVIELLDEIDALRAEYNTLRQEHNTLKEEHNTLRTEHNTLRKEHEELQVDHGMVREERDEFQKENCDLKIEKARLEAYNAELLAASTVTRNATPTRESSSANIDAFYTAPSSPQLGQDQLSRGNPSRAPTEIYPPVTPPRASVSRNHSGLPTPPTTNARRPAGTPPLNGCRSSSSSRRSFRENTPGAASVRGATPGSPSHRPRRSPPLRQLSSQSHRSAGRGPTREPSYREVRSPFVDVMQDMRRDFEARYSQMVQLQEHAVRRHVEQLQRQDELRRVQAELAEVCSRLETLEERHRVQTQEYQDLLGQYRVLSARMQELNGLIGTFTGKATALLNMPDMPSMGPTVEGSA